MKQMQNVTHTTQKDEIDLLELFNTLKKRKKMIFLITAVITLLGTVYALTAKPTLAYEGEALVEIGKIINTQDSSDGKYSPLQIESLDNVFNLKELTTTLFEIEASVPKDTNLLVLSFTDSNKSAIKPKLDKAVSYILNRNNQISKLYAGKNRIIKMTHLVKEIKIEDITKQPKRKLIVIVAFITGLILSIFLAFFLEFLQGIGKIEDSDILQ